MLTDRSATLGFIGLGLMGTAMTLRLLERGWRVAVWNLEPDRVPPLVAAGAVACASPTAVATSCDIALICVLNTDAVADCVFGRQGVAASPGRCKILIDHSTADPAATRAMAARLRRQTGMGWVDAPVSGGPAAARDGSMTVMAGGDEADVAAIQEVMRDLAANFTHIGPSGAGQTAKIINQAIVGTGYVLMAEALILAEKAGIDAARLPEALAGGHADSNLLRKLYPQMQARDFDPPRAFARQLLKDMKAVEDFAQNLDLDLPLVKSAVAQYARYVEQGNEMQDSASVVRLYEK
jgi:3-hydroxyisobutyrate dehydrogenase